MKLKRNLIQSCQAAQEVSWAL